MSCKNWFVSVFVLLTLLLSACQPVVMPDAGVSVQPEAAPPALPENGSLAEVNDIRVYYEVRGEGEPLLLMPGDMRTTEDVADLVELLAPAYQVVVMDARGRGRSTDSEQPLTMAIMADDAVALMDELGIDKAHIVSWASSAGVALEMAMRYPERVDKLVTYAPNYTVDGLAPDHLAWFKSLTVEDMVPMFEEQYSRTAPDPDYLPVILDRLQELILREPNYTPEMLSQIQAPTLVLDGDLDDWIVREHLEGMAEAIPSAELVFLPDLGHFAPFENPVAWTNAVLSFLAQPTEITKAAETVPRFEPAECLYPDLAGVDAECGYLVVREDRTDPDSPTIRIQVIKVAAVSAEPAPDPIVAIPGGPGSGGPFWTWLFGVSPMSEVMRAERDLYILETRGAMSSEPGLYCPETVVDWAPMVEMTMAEEAEVRLAQFLACHERLVAEGINLSAYGYLDIAHDVADLAAVLDLETVNIYGVSAGTPPAMLVMAVMPEGIRSVILDSVYPPETTFMPYLAEYLQTSLDQVFAACRADTACAEAYPDLEGALVDVLERLRAEPVMVAVAHASGETFAVPVDDVKFVHYLHGVVFIGDGFTAIPAAIYTAYDGDLQAAAEGWLDYVAGEHSTVSAEEGSWAKGMMYSALCLAEGQHIGLTDATAANLESEALPSIQDWAVWMLGDYLGPCDDWDVELPASSIALEPVASEVPVLMLTGLYDPEGRASLSRDAADLLLNSFFYELPSGHGLVFTGCGLDLMTQFLQNPTTAPDAACIDAMTIDWILLD